MEPANILAINLTWGKIVGVAGINSLTRKPLGLILTNLRRVPQMLRVRHYSAAVMNRLMPNGFAGSSGFTDGATRLCTRKGDVKRFLMHLEVKEHVAASSQNQDLAGILFL